MNSDATRVHLNLEASNKLYRDIGKMEAEIKDIRYDIADIREHLEEITKFVREFQGDKKWLLGLITGISALAGFTGALIAIIVKAYFG